MKIINYTFSFLCISFSSFGQLTQSRSVNSSTQAIGTTTICELKDNKVAAYSFTCDDGILAADQSYNADFKRLKLRGSMAIIAGKMNSSGTANINAFKSILADGCFDITNHSMSHANFTKITKTQAGKDSLVNEIATAQTLLKSIFPGQDVITMANPYTVTTTSADSLIKLGHFAARNGYAPYNSLSPTDKEWFQVSFQNTYNPTTAKAKTLDEMNSYVTSTLKNKKWLVILAHGIADSGPYNIPQTTITPHFEFVASKMDSIWPGTFNEVVKYIREKQHAVVAIKQNTASNIVVSVTHTFYPTIFNFPLTMRTVVPTNWTNVTVIQNGISKKYSSKTEGAERCVYYDVVPNLGDASLSQSSITALQNEFLENKRSVSVDPNGQFVKFNGIFEATQTTIFTLNGLKVCEERIMNNRISITALPKGIYVLKVLINNEYFTSKIVKN